MYFVWEELHISKSTDFLKRQEVEVSQVVARQVKVLPPNEILVFLPNFTFFSAKRDNFMGLKAHCPFPIANFKKKIHRDTFVFSLHVPDTSERDKGSPSDQRKHSIY